MANYYIKGTLAGAKMSALLVIYQFYKAGGRNWTVIDETAGWAGGAPASGEWFVLRRALAWANGVGSQYPELLFCGNDSSGTLTYGGPSANVWSIGTKSFNLVYSPDGGWDTVNNLFVPPGALAAKQLTFLVGVTETTSNVYLVDTADDLSFWIYSAAASYYAFGHAGEITRSGSSAATPRPTACVLGRMNLAATSGYIGYPGVAQVPNAAYSGWVNAAVDEPTWRGDTYPTTRDEGLYRERLCDVYDTGTPGGIHGNYVHTRRAGTGIVAGTVTTDGTRVYFNGLSFPWV
jgi:hypothetical protein